VRRSCISSLTTDILNVQVQQLHPPKSLWFLTNWTDESLASEEALEIHGTACTLNRVVTQVTAGVRVQSLIYASLAFTLSEFGEVLRKHPLSLLVFGWKTNLCKGGKRGLTAREEWMRREEGKEGKEEGKS
jgi:hypothetical protein